MPRVVLCSLVLQALSLAWGVQQYFASAVAVTMPSVFGLATSAGLLVAMARRQNWARIAWLVLYVLAGATEPIVSAILRHHPGPVPATLGGTDVLFIALDLLALALVFLPGSSMWFCASRVRPQTRDEPGISQ